MAEQQQTHGQLPPGTVRPKGVRPRFHYELIGCGLRGHEIVGTDVAKIRPIDDLLVREPGDGLRWYRCVRCDAWVPLPPPVAPAREYLPDRSDIALPLRGRPLRDRYVLRLIALDRLGHFFVLGGLAVSVVVFIPDPAAPSSPFYPGMGAVPGGGGGPKGRAAGGRPLQAAPGPL